MPPNDASPESKNEPRYLRMREIVAPEDIAGALDDVLAAIGRGELTAREGLTIAKVIEARRKAMEVIEFAQRLDAIERNQ